MLGDYHMHLERGPFTLDWLAEFVRVASERGLGEIGITEHIYRFREAQTAYGAWWGEVHERLTGPGTATFARDWWIRRGGQSLAAYAGVIADAKAQGWPVLLGIEADYFPGAEQAIRTVQQLAPFDYTIGSVHWLGNWGFDQLGVPDLWADRDVDAMYRDYFAALIQAAQSGLFQVMAHPDLIKVMGHRPTSALELEAIYRDVAAAFAAGGVAVELSTAGLRKPVGELYPAPALLRACYQAGVPLSLASDAHQPADVGLDFAQARAFARDCGYRERVVFRQGQPTLLPLA